MCVFVNTLSKHSRSGAPEKRQNILLSLKPTDKNEYYRFRILNFSTSKNDRGNDFIVRYVHTKWGQNEKGKPIIESRVVCPVTKYVKWSGNRYEDCPICRFANNNFIAFKNSGYKDRESSKKNRDFSRRFEAYVPVYVVHDPIYEANNGKLKVICFTDREEYQKFFDLAVKTAKERNVNVCNAKDAVDFCIRIARVSEVRNEGKPNEYVWSHNVIKKMTFSPNPTTISQITSELIDSFPYDDEYYVSSSPEELQEFYDKYCRMKIDDVDMSDDEDADIPEIAETKPKAALKQEVKQPKQSEAEDVLGDDDVDMSDDEEDDIPFDDDIVEEVAKPKPVHEKPVAAESAKELDVDKMLADLNISSEEFN